jgi:hypothetical protein
MAWATAIVHELIEDAGVAIARTGRSNLHRRLAVDELIEWTVAHDAQGVTDQCRGVLPNLTQAIVADATEIVTTQT